MFDQDPKPAILAPSLLAADAAHLMCHASAARRGGAGMLHLDIMDGHFVPNLSFGPHVCAALARAGSLPLDVHLMVSRPDSLIDTFAESGASVLTVHAELGVRKVMRALKRIRALGVRTGLSIKPATDISAVLPFLPLTDMILLMTVEPGFGGQGFLPGSMERISALRALLDREKPEAYLEIDGGVRESNIGLCAEAGANVFVAGSASFGATAEETEARVRSLLRLLQT